MMSNKYKEYKWSNSFRHLSIILTMTGVVFFLSGVCFSEKPGQKTFHSPDEAFKAMVDAMKTGNDKELKAIYGPETKFIFPADPRDDIKGWEWFLSAYDKKNSVKTTHDDRAVLYVGKENWPWPVSVVKVGDKQWRFETKAGKEEILARRIGQNEIAVVQVCLAYVDAQQKYAQTHRVNGLPEYAMKFLSDAGKDNGLCSNPKDSGEHGLLGPLIAGAGVSDDESPSAVKQVPYHGYYYKILKKQGPNALGGAYDYVLNGVMVGGFALVACPASYNSTGVKTFIVNQDDVVYEKDLGEDTDQLARAMVVFNPDASWKTVE